MTTTDGLTRPTTPTKSFWRAPAIAGDAGADVVGVGLDGGAPDALAPVEHAATSSDPPNTSAPMRLGRVRLVIGVSIDARAG
jgi:hypothetical protein